MTSPPTPLWFDLPLRVFTIIHDFMDDLSRALTQRSGMRPERLVLIESSNEVLF